MERSERAIGLAEILEKYFDCPEPFLKTPKLVYDEDGFEDYEYFTVEGAQAYNSLTDLIYALRNIGALTDKECDSTVDTLDMIASRSGY